MKKVLCSFFLFIACNFAFAQPHLRVDNVVGFPVFPTDSAFEAGSYNIDITISNLDTADYTGPIVIVLQANAMPPDTLYSDSISNIIAGGSSIFTRPQYVMTPAHFDDGENIIVVWPQAVSVPMQGDSLTIPPVWFISLEASVPIINKEQLSIYPNPSSKFISFNVPDGLLIKQVRIFDTEGREIYESAFIRKFISIEEWPTGIYLIEVERADGSKQILKLVKE